MAVIVNVYTPGTVKSYADIESVDVNVGVPLMFQLILTPLGLPVTVILTVVLKPLKDVTVMTGFGASELPATTEPEVGNTDTRKYLGGVTDRENVQERVFPPPVPVIVITYVPGVVDTVVFIVSVEVTVPFAGGVAGFGLKVTVTPDGRPDAVKLTGLLNPFCDVSVTVDVSENPASTEPKFGSAEILKSGDGGGGNAETVNEYVQLCVLCRPDPVMIIL